MLTQYLERSRSLLGEISDDPNDLNDQIDVIPEEDDEEEDEGKPSIFGRSKTLSPKPFYSPGHSPLKQKKGTEPIKKISSLELDKILEEEEKEPRVNRVIPRVNPEKSNILSIKTITGKEGEIFIPPKSPMLEGHLYRAGTIILRSGFRFFVLNPVGGTFTRYKKKADYPNKPLEIISLKSICMVKRIKRAWYQKRNYSYFEVINI